MVVQRLNSLDPRDRVATVPFQKPGLLEAVGLTREECEKEAWAVRPDGRRYHGGEAVIAALAWALGIELPLRLYELPGLRQLGEAVYAWVAANRAKLPGVKPYCQQHPQECGRK